MRDEIQMRAGMINNLFLMAPYFMQSDTHLFFSFKTVKHLNNVFMLQPSHYFYLPFQVLQILVRTTNFWNELQSNNLKDKLNHHREQPLSIMKIKKESKHR